MPAEALEPTEPAALAPDPCPMPLPRVPTPLASAGCAGDGALEHALGALESRLATLGEALRVPDEPAIAQHACELQRALAQAIDQFSQAAERGPVALGLRRRLAAASGQVAAQRNALAQATAALDRAIETLLPRSPRGGAAGDIASG